MSICFQRICVCLCIPEHLFLGGRGDDGLLRCCLCLYLREPFTASLLQPPASVILTMLFVCVCLSESLRVFASVCVLPDRLGISARTLSRAAAKRCRISHFHPRERCSDRSCQARRKTHKLNYLSFQGVSRYRPPALKHF